MHAVHFGQQLVQRLVVFAVLSAIPFSPDDVDFVNENDRALFVFLLGPRAGFLEQFPDPACPTPTYISTNSLPEADTKTESE